MHHKSVFWLAALMLSSVASPFASAGNADGKSRQGVENLLLAGRCLSGEPAAAGAVRVMPTCMAMGQAAGTAAALCLGNGATPRSLDASALVGLLRKQGAFLG
jgi:hypothetical protein